jgi:myosin regulatory light chain 12
MIDQNRDGYIDKDDLLDMMTSLGKDPSNDYLEKMIKEAPGPINFTMFLTLFGEKLNGTDPEENCYIVLPLTPRQTLYYQ